MARHPIRISALMLLCGIFVVTVSACDKATDTVPAVHENGTLEVSDSDLTMNVQRALIRSDDLKAFQITAKSQKGDVLLTGVVNNQIQYDLAASISSEIGGVHAVHNEIIIVKIPSHSGSSQK